MPLGSSPMTRDAIPDLLERGIRKVFFQEYANRGKQFEEIYNVNGSQKRQETDVINAGLSLYERKMEGNSPTFDVGREAWKRVYTHNTFALGIEITEEGLEDDLYGYYVAMGKELGIAAYYTKEVEAADLFTDLSAEVYNAASTSYPLLSTTHFRIDGDTWSNRPTVATDLSIDSLETALAAWRTNMVDQRGRKITPQPSILVVGPGDEFMAERLLSTPQRPQGADNDVNAVRRRRNLRVVVWDFMPNDGRWFLLADPSDTGLNYFNRVPNMMRRHDDPRTGNLLMIGRYRESHGASHVTGIYGSP